MASHCGGGFEMTLDRVNRLLLSGGGSVLLKRGAACHDSLAPRGSGREGAPIVLGAYGTGPRPVLDAKGSRAAIALADQEFWEISDLEITGATYRGISITAHGGRTRRHLRITNVLLHGLTGNAPDTLGGLVVVSGSRFDDVVIDRVTAYDTRQWYQTASASAQPVPAPREAAAGTGHGPASPRGARLDGDLPLRAGR
jgi:hypothetical protein